MASGNKLIFADSEAARDAILESQKKEIAKLYQEWADEIGERAKYYAHKTTASSVVSEMQMKELQKQLQQTGQQVSNEIYSMVKGNIYTVADAVVKDSVEWMKQFGFSEDGLNAAFNSVPDNVVRMLVTGQIYQGGWNLSSRIWSDNEATMKTAYQIVAKGMAENLPIYDIAKQLEKYVQPGAAKAWNPYILMRNTKTGELERKKIYKRQVDYNAQRLARTLVQHGYQQSFIATTKNNPFVLKYEWLANGSRPCPLCTARNGEQFEKDKLPMDHPNGQCTMVPITDDDIVNKLADWINSPDGTFPEIDAFAEQVGGYVVQPQPKTAADWVSKWGNSQKSWGNWYDHLDATAKAEAKALKDQSGLTWTQWYEQNVYNGTTPIKDGKLVKQTKDGLTDLQKEWFAKVGYKANGVPSNFTDFALKLSYEQQSELLKLAGGSWSDPHPFQKMEAFYNANLAVNAKQSQAVAKEAAKQVSKNVQSGTSGMIKSTQEYLAAAKANPNVQAMLDMEDKVFGKFTKSERASLEVYTGSSYKKINGYYRDIAKGMSEAQARIKYGDYIADHAENCKAALSKVTLGENLTLRRGTDVGDLAGLFMDGDFATDKASLYGKSAEELNAMFAGKSGKYAGFTSTSSQWDRGFTGDVEIVFEASSKTQASSIMRISQFGTSEGETLLNANTEVVCERIERSDGHMDSKIRVFLKIIDN